VDLEFPARGSLYLSGQLANEEPAPGEEAGNVRNDADRVHAGNAQDEAFGCWDVAGRILPGIGQAKLERYGEIFLKVIQASG
jgi:hypothetical protein